MVVDRYTKCVLTVIAGCLLWICVMTTGLGLHAQQPAADATAARAPAAQPVIVVGWTAATPVGVRLEAVPAPVPVSLSEIRPGAAWEPVRVKVEPTMLPGPAQ